MPMISYVSRRGVWDLQSRQRLTSPYIDGGDKGKDQSLRVRTAEGLALDYIHLQEHFRRWGVGNVSAQGLGARLGNRIL